LCSATPEQEDAPIELLCRRHRRLVGDPLLPGAWHRRYTLIEARRQGAGLTLVSTMVTLQQAALRRRHRRAQLVALPGVGHVPMHDDPELVARTVLDFVDAAPIRVRPA
jgi:pimeloyl-ACP methyl ester carboxylesterase